MLEVPLFLKESICRAGISRGLAVSTSNVKCAERREEFQNCVKQERMRSVQRPANAVLVEIDDALPALVPGGDRLEAGAAQRQHDRHGDGPPVVSLADLQVHEARWAQRVPALVERRALIPGQVVLRLDEERMVGQVRVGVQLCLAGFCRGDEPIAVVGRQRRVVEVAGADLGVVPWRDPHGKPLNVSVQRISEPGEHSHARHEHRGPRDQHDGNGDNREREPADRAHAGHAHGRCRPYERPHVPPYAEYPVREPLAPVVVISHRRPLHPGQFWHIGRPKGRRLRARFYNGGGGWPDRSGFLRVTATTTSSAASGATSAMKSPTTRMPRATRAAVNPTIMIATVVSGQSWRKSGEAAAGTASAGLATAVTALVSRRSAMPSRSRTETIRVPGWAATSSRSSGCAGSAAWDTAPPPAAHATTRWPSERRTR